MNIVTADEIRARAEAPKQSIEGDYAQLCKDVMNLIEDSIKSNPSNTYVLWHGIVPPIIIEWLQQGKFSIEVSSYRNENLLKISW